MPLTNCPLVDGYKPRKWTVPELRIEVRNRYVINNTEILSTPCWDWNRRRDDCGYGWWRALDEDKAHRVVWRLFRGDIPPLYCVCHKCDRPCCINPDHLFCGTRKANSEDMVKKGRGPKQFGAANPNAVLSASDVRIIRESYKPYIVTKPMLAKRFGVCVGTLEAILYGRLWRNL